MIEVKEKYNKDNINNYMNVNEDNDVNIESRMKLNNNGIYDDNNQQKDTLNIYFKLYFYSKMKEDMILIWKTIIMTILYPLLKKEN